MSEATGDPKRGILVAVTAGAVLIVAVIAVLIGMSSGSDDTTATTDSPPASDGGSGETTGGAEDETQAMESGTDFLAEPKGGQEAIDALGDKLEVVAEKNGMTAEELKELLLRDSSAQVTPGGFIRYIDQPVPEN